VVWAVGLNMEKLGYVAAFALLVVCHIVACGWAFSVLWGWFVVPMFGLPVLTIPAAAGLLLVASFLVDDPPEKTSVADFNDLVIRAAGKLAGKCVVGVVLGWVILQFI